MLGLWVLSPAGGAYHGVATPWDAVPVSTTACLAGLVLAALVVVRSFFLQQFGWCMVVLAVLRSACTSWGRLRCSPRPRSRMLSLLSSRLVLKFVGAGLSDVAVIVFATVVCPARCLG